jgi:choloylglycine hydrolase
MRTLRKIIAGSIIMIGLGTMPALACTAMEFTTQDGTTIYARTLEWGVSDLHSELEFVPRNKIFTSRLDAGQSGMSWHNKYAFTAIIAGGFPYAADGLNETGLTVGMLFYPGFAEYQSADASKDSSTIINGDFGNYILGNFKTVAEVKSALPGIRVVKSVDLEKQFGTVLPLHFIVTDATGASIIVEYTKGQLNIFDNAVGVLTNSPSYDWHLLNLRNYANLQPTSLPARSINGVSLAPFGAGSGMLGLPGDFTPPSRFIRAVAFIHTMEPVKTAQEGISAASAMLNNFDIPKGLIREGTLDNPILGYTQWSAIADTKHEVYYYWTAYNRRMRCIDLTKMNLNGAKIITMPLDKVRVEDMQDLSSQFTQ